MKKKAARKRKREGEWTQLSIRLNEEIQDNVIAEMTLLGFEGFLQEPELLKATIARKSWRSKLLDGVRGIIARHSAEKDGTAASIRVSHLRKKNWNEEWEKEIREVEATDTIVLMPSWIRNIAPFKGKTIIRIDPKMSFGTGHHETTRLCLRLAEKYVTEGIHVLDFGCGTGVLAIAAIKLGARQATCIDIDEWAIKNTLENGRRNRVSGNIEAYQGGMSKIPNRTFDLLFANIDFYTLSQNLPQLEKRLRRGGVLILSGILASDFESLSRFAHENRLIVNETIFENEWIALALKKSA